MCTYNHSPFIAQAIEGVLMQKTTFPLELIIGEDCSTDNTRQIVNEYFANNPDVIVTQFPESNMGSTGNILSLIHAARGKYIAICDGDDYWTDSLKLQKQVDFMQGNEAYGMVCGVAAKYIQDKGKIEGNLGDISAESYESLLGGYSDVAAPTMFMKTDLLKRCIHECQYFIKNNLFFDTAITYWFSYHSKIKFFNDISAVYRVLPDSGCHTSNFGKRLSIDLNYFKIKIYFLLRYPLKDSTKIEEVLDSIFKYNLEIVRFAGYVGETEVRKSLSYKMGKAISMPFKTLIKLSKNKQ